MVRQMKPSNHDNNNNPSSGIAYASGFTRSVIVRQKPQHSPFNFWETHSMRGEAEVGAPARDELFTWPWVERNPKDMSISTESL